MVRAGQAAAPMPADLPALGEVRDTSVEAPHGLIPIRLYHPVSEPVGSVVLLHGGGWMVGNLTSSDILCRRLAAAANCEVINVDYRLAPEHPFPQPLDDAFAVLEWATARRGPVVVAGESSGGNMAAACAIRARDAGGPPIAGQFLAYPITDHDWNTPSHRNAGRNTWLLSTADMQWFFAHYVGSDYDPADPLIAPLRVLDPRGLPAALIAVGELDLLRDDAINYSRRLDDAGVPVTLRIFPGMLHNFLGAAHAIPLAAEAVVEAAAWIRGQLENAKKQAA